MSNKPYIVQEKNFEAEVVVDEIHLPDGRIVNVHETLDQAHERYNETAVRYNLLTGSETQVNKPKGTATRRRFRAHNPHGKWGYEDAVRANELYMTDDYQTVMDEFGWANEHAAKQFCIRMRTMLRDEFDYPIERKIVKHRIRRKK